MHPLDDWIADGRRGHYNWLLICWDAVEREWMPVYSREWLSEPARHAAGVTLWEVFRVDLRGNGPPDVRHVDLTEEP
jgi:hypothetical protein